MNIYTIFPTLDPMHTDDDDNPHGRASEGNIGLFPKQTMQSSGLNTPSSVARDDLAPSRSAHDASIESLDLTPASLLNDQGNKEFPQHHAPEQPATLDIHPSLAVYVSAIFFRRSDLGCMSADLSEKHDQ